MLLDEYLDITKGKGYEGMTPEQEAYWREDNMNNVRDGFLGLGEGLLSAPVGAAEAFVGPGVEIGKSTNVKNRGSTAVNEDGETKSGGKKHAPFYRKLLPMKVGVGEMVSRGFDIQHSVLLQGYLTKQSIKGRFGKKWTKRWMVLHGNVLYYFKSE